MSRPIYIKNISADTLHRREHVSAVESFIGVKESSVTKACVSRNTTPLKNKYLLGYNKTELISRHPEFHISKCSYKILPKNRKRCYISSSATRMAKYLGVKLSTFTQIVTEFLEAYQYTLSTSDKWHLLDGVLSITPPVHAKGKYIVLPSKRTVVSIQTSFTLIPRLTYGALDSLWRDWNQNGHNVQRFGQYVMNQSNFKLPQEFEYKNNIDLFFETDAEKCYDVIKQYLASIQSE